jgi:hypothetical protein
VRRQRSGERNTTQVGWTKTYGFLNKLLLKLTLAYCFGQGCGSGSGLDPDSIVSVDPDSEPGSGSRRAKMTHKSREIKLKSSCFEVLDGRV